MVLQLPVKQDTCSKPHPVLLQYVLFLNIEERRDSTVLASEVWVEQQHGEVDKVPKPLKQDNQVQCIRDVADKVRGGGDAGYPEAAAGTHIRMTVRPIALQIYWYVYMQYGMYGKHKVCMTVQWVKCLLYIVSIM